MLETPHVILGAAIAAKIPNPFISIPLSLMSHFVLDKVPHWNPHLYTETQKLGHPGKTSTVIAVADIGLSLAMGFWVAGNYSPDYQRGAVVLACCLASVLPDVVKYPYYYFKARFKTLVAWVKFERKLQVDAPFWPGVLTQLLTVLTAIWWISS